MHLEFGISDFLSLFFSGHPVPQVIWYKDDVQLDRYCGLPKYEIFRNGQNHSLHIYKYVCLKNEIALVLQPVYISLPYCITLFFERGFNVVKQLSRCFSVNLHKDFVNYEILSTFTLAVG